MSEQSHPQPINTAIHIPTPFDAKHLERIADCMGEFRHVLEEVILSSELQPSLAELALPAVDSDFRLKMGTNIALRTMLDFTNGLPAITRLGELACVETSESSNNLIMQVRPAKVTRSASGLYRLT